MFRWKYFSLSKLIVQFFASPVVFAVMCVVYLLLLTFISHFSLVCVSFLSLLYTLPLFVYCVCLKCVWVGCKIMILLFFFCTVSVNVLCGFVCFVGLSQQKKKTIIPNNNISPRPINNNNRWEENWSRTYHSCLLITSVGSCSNSRCIRVLRRGFTILAHVLTITVHRFFFFFCGEQKRNENCCAKDLKQYLKTTKKKKKTRENPKELVGYRKMRLSCLQLEENLIKRRIENKSNVELQRFQHIPYENGNKNLYKHLFFFLVLCLFWQNWVSNAVVFCSLVLDDVTKKPNF